MDDVNLLIILADLWLILVEFHDFLVCDEEWCDDDTLEENEETNYLNF